MSAPPEPAPVTPAPDRLVGVVKHWNREKGFGFIENEQFGKVYVHRSEVQLDSFHAFAEAVRLGGERVEFEMITGDDGRAKAGKVTGPSRWRSWRARAHASQPIVQSRQLGRRC